MMNRTLPAVLLTIGLSLVQALAQMESKTPVEMIHAKTVAHKPAMVKAAFMGVTAERISHAMNSQLKLPEGLGLVVTHVVPDGPAAEAGLQKHDVLHKLDDQLLVNFEQFAVLVRLHEPGDNVTLSVIRGGGPMAITVTLTEREVPEMSFERAPHSGGWFVPNGPDPFGDATNSRPGIDGRTLRTEILRTLPEGPFGPANENVIYPQDRYKMRIADGKHKIIINKLSDEGPWVTVEDSEGNVIHEGVWHAEDDLTSELPADVIEKIHDVLNMTAPGGPIRIKADEIKITTVPGQPETKDME